MFVLFSLRAPDRFLLLKGSGPFLLPGDPGLLINLPRTWLSHSATLFSSCLQSFPASVLTMNIQGWFPLGLTDLSSLLSKGLSRVFSSTINSSALRLLHGRTLTSLHDCWKSHSFDYMDLCHQSDVSVSDTLPRFVIACLPRKKLLYTCNEFINIWYRYIFGIYLINKSV